jgi:hypothetical protein
MPAKHPTTNDNIRDLIDTKFESLRLELKDDIKGVSNDVVALRRDVVNNELKQAVSSTKIGMLITGITIIVSAAITLLINKIGGHIA